MKEPRIVTALDELSWGSSEEVHLAIGMFDGLHLGHQAVIEAAKHSAVKNNACVGVLTFSPHPSRILYPEKAVPLIMPAHEKHAMLQKLGVDLIIDQAFTKAFAKIKAEDFLPLIKQHIPGLKSLYVGDAFRFGQGRSGDVALLVELGKALGVDVFSLKRIQCSETVISSTRIRKMIAQGDMQEANKLLGYTYFSEGQCLCDEGQCALEFNWAPELKPLSGAYAVRILAEELLNPLHGLAYYDAQSARLKIYLLEPSKAFYFKGGARVDWLHLISAGASEYREQDKQKAINWFQEA